MTRFAVDTSRRFVIRYKKDRLGRIDSVHALNPGGSIQFATRRYTYDPYTGRLAQLLIGGKRMRFKYNSEGLADSVLFDSVGVKRWMKYTSTHQPYEVNFSPAAHSSAFQRRYGLDSLYRIQELAQRNGSGWDIERYRYNGKGELSGREVTLGLSSHCGNRTDPYGYDCQPAPAMAINHDAVGNTLYDTTDDSLATEYAFAYDIGNRVTLREHLRKGLPSEWGFTDYTHDRDGNRDSLRAHTGAVTTFGWSADGKLLSVTQGSTTLGYGYNAFGQLVQRKRNGTPERLLLWDGDKLFAELDGSASGRIAEYVYHGIDTPAALITGATSISKVRYFEQDQIGNVVGVFGDSVDQQYEYSYRGTLESSTGTLADTNRVQWKGAIFEGDIAGLYYMRNRWYDPGTGRFLSEDPIGLQGGINVYAYVAADPINKSDPFGLDVVDRCRATPPDTLPGKGQAVAPVNVCDDGWWRQPAGTSAASFTNGWNGNPNALGYSSSGASRSKAVRIATHSLEQQRLNQCASDVLAEALYRNVTMGAIQGFRRGLTQASTVGLRYAVRGAVVAAAGGGPAAPISAFTGALIGFTGGALGTIAANTAIGAATGVGAAVGEAVAARTFGSCSSSTY